MLQLPSPLTSTQPNVNAVGQVWLATVFLTVKTELSLAAPLVGSISGPASAKELAVTGVPPFTHP